ncbi:FMN-dependent NADH-azoreductase [Melghirimyces profundicolus]|uniref:FMN dependent NADH:quinone oxidoreductase n=1 Tax=Melghirimyces profundicolus TaxID=1242148 RepID=A0A2T6AZX1_9BACL|nr:FMN-dependent NADH-azoreductase [Melghirimyces profundicolus]PTX49347.1 FMN-dependent NADH-azoreductase [Melghirimyces profundicolus]
MGKVLYITANPKKAQDSYGLTVGDELIRQYRDRRPDDEVVHIDVFREEIPLLDEDILHAWGKLASEQPVDSLTEDEKRKVTRLNELVDQFIEADRYVFVTPMWNFGVPPLMKAYIDTVSVAGKTFQYTEEGPVGLLKGKKAVVIQASGGIYSEGPAAGLDFCSKYLVSVLNFLGVTDVETLFVEGMNQFPDKAEAIRDAACERAAEAARALAADPVSVS